MPAPKTKISNRTEALSRFAKIGEIASDPSVWTGEEFNVSDAWKFTADPKEINHLVDMTKQISGRIGEDTKLLLNMSSDDFDLGPFTERVEDIMTIVKDGLGVALYRGLPMNDISLMEAAIIYWGMGLHIGNPMSNNPEGDMMGHVMDAGKDQDDPKHRGYQTNATMDYHCDQTDVVTLLCINSAKHGGLSKIASSVAIYNEMMRKRPDLVEVLSQPYCWTKHSEKNDGELNFYESPVFNFLDGVLCTSFGPKHMEKGHALPEAPDMLPQQREAIAYMEQIAEDFHAEMDLKRGDIQFANNYTILHTRTGFEDWPELERKRALWRLWLSVPNFLPQTPYSARWAKGVNLAETERRLALVYPA